MKKSIHDGAVTYSVTVPNPAPGEGKHAKTPAQIRRRHIRNGFKQAMIYLMKGVNSNDSCNFR